MQHLISSLRSSLRKLAASIIKLEAIPQHVAFIMDGNRRYAQQLQMQKLQGHIYGYQRLIDALEWCFDLGVKCVSVYAFSLDNYNRSQQEVDTLMHLAEEKLRNMIKDIDILNKYGIQVRIIGDLAPAPSSVVQAAEEIMAATRHHSNGILNICFSYTSSREMVQALDLMMEASQTTTASTNPTTIDSYLYTRDCPPVDLLIRTSGETRLSDFLLWQSRYALLVFTDVLWPEFGFLDFTAAVLEYQRKYKHLELIRHCNDRRQDMHDVNADERDDGIVAIEQQQDEEDWREHLLVSLQPIKTNIIASTRSPNNNTSPRGVTTPPDDGVSSPSTGSEQSDELCGLVRREDSAISLAGGGGVVGALRQRNITTTAAAAVAH